VNLSDSPSSIDISKEYKSDDSDMFNHQNYNNSLEDRQVFLKPGKFGGTVLPEYQIDPEQEDKSRMKRCDVTAPIVNTGEFWDPLIMAETPISSATATLKWPHIPPVHN
jgi:hypothetical protein